MEEMLLFVHIAGGSIALICALMAVSSKKGANFHRKVGRIYALSMATIGITAIPLAIISEKMFLFIIAIFSSYLVFAGWRFAVNRSGKPSKLDWFAVFVMLITAITMALGAYILYAEGDDMWVTLAVFAIISAGIGLTDMKSHISRRTIGNKRIARHLTNMLAGTIATLTAALVTNVSTDPVWMAWIAPTVIITPVIIYWNRKTLKS
ncbi:MAG: hypothetical protein AAEF23_05220 [Gammaproteobacteria bacterium]